jgi:cell division protein FtsI (penicillin-binding protein 3)
MEDPFATLRCFAMRFGWVFVVACTPARPYVPDAPKIDLPIQQIVEDELQHAIDDWKPDTAFAIVLRDSEIIAVAGWDDGKTDAHLPLTKTYVTGSTLKSFTIAIALDESAIQSTDKFDCAPRTYPDAELRDVEPHDDLLSVQDILVTSSNVGASRIEDKLGLAKLEEGLKRFHFGMPPAPFPDPILAGSEAEGLFAGGELYATTPLQVARAYDALFHDGAYDGPEGRNEAVSRETALVVQDMLAEAVRRGTGEHAKIKGHRVIGKTGTAMYSSDRVYASFVGAVMEGSPETILVGIIGSADVTGPKAAAPVFARIAERALKLDRKHGDEDD